MPPLAPVNAVKVMISGTNSGTTDWGLREFFAYPGTPPTIGDLNAITAEVGSAWTADVEPIQGTNLSLTQIVAQDLSSSMGLSSVVRGTITGTRSGTGVEAALAANVAYGIGRHYRGGHPRTYVPCGVDTDVLNPANWTSAFATLVTSAWTNFLAAVAGTSGLSCGALTHVNIPFYKGVYTTTPPWRGPGFTYPPKPNPAPVPDPITSVICKQAISSQKRRRTALTP